MGKRNLLALALLFGALETDEGFARRRYANYTPQQQPQQQSHGYCTNCGRVHEQNTYQHQNTPTATPACTTDPNAQYKGTCSTDSVSICRISNGEETKLQIGQDGFLYYLSTTGQRCPAESQVAQALNKQYPSINESKNWWAALSPELQEKVKRFKERYNPSTIARVQTPVISQARPSNSTNYYQSLAQSRADAMARNRYMPMNHAISGAPERPMNLFEGIGMGGPNCETCRGPDYGYYGGVVADASAIGSDGRTYRVRFYAP